MTEFNFEKSRALYCETLRNHISSPEAAEDIDFLSSDISASDGEKLALDQAFKDELFRLIKLDSKTEDFVNLLNLAVTAVKNDQCSTSALFVMMSDLFDMITLNRCDDVFRFVEERVATWKMEVFHNAGKNYLLRTCNDLLRRLSKSQNTVFCGRIQLFLARLFPLEEKSGLNLMSQFNLENVTIYNTKPEDYDQPLKLPSDEKEAKMEVEEGEMEEGSNIPIDYNLYRKFWSLQDFFRRPAQCYEKVSWKTFVNYADEVLGCFSSYKLDDIKSARRKLEQEKDTSATQLYFAKYLTSEKLLDLQLSDSNFRRYVLIQFLILFQYLNSQVKWKNPNQLLTDEQNVWMKDSAEKVFRILRETPPDGEKFAEAIEHILNREENWNNWKNEGCASYIRRKDESKSKAPLPSRPRKRSIGDDLKSSGSKLIKMGNAELTRLWNLCPDNMAACRSEKRNFMPTMEEFFEESIEQMDPSGGIEDEYKLVNNPTFAWKALRLLASKSPYFFAQPQGGQQIKKLPQYLDHMLNKLAKEMQSTPAEELKSDAEESTMENGNAEDETLENNKDQEGRDEGTEAEDEMESLESGSRLSGDMLRQLAARVCEDWKKLAIELGFQEDEIIYFEGISTDLAEQAYKMLSLWVENEGEKSTVAAIRVALNEIGQSNLANELFNDQGSSSP